MEVSLNITIRLATPDEIEKNECQFCKKKPVYRWSGANFFCNKHHLEELISYETDSSDSDDSDEDNKNNEDSDSDEDSEDSDDDENSDDDEDSDENSDDSYDEEKKNDE